MSEARGIPGTPPVFRVHDPGGSKAGRAGRPGGGAGTAGGWSGPFRPTGRSVIRAAAVSLLAVWIVTPSGAAPPSGTPRGTVQRLQMEAPSVGGGKRNVRVYLPPSYSDPDSALRRYPVVYMLHGWPGSDGNLLEWGHANDTADSLIARHAIPEVILVFPNGAGTGLLGRSYWINSYDGRRRLEDFVTRDLIDWTDRHYRTVASPSGRGTIGISEGGDAALNLAFKHPELFSACGGHSGDYVLEKGLGTSAFLGPEPGATRLLEENSVSLYVERIVPQLRRQRIYFDCGTSDESIGHNRAFHRALESLGVPHEYHEFQGSHTWSYWGRHLRESLLAVAGALR
jgi:S-formylglutathione hydrolase FrmB